MSNCTTNEVTQAYEACQKAYSNALAAVARGESVEGLVDIVKAVNATPERYTTDLAKEQDKIACRATIERAAAVPAEREAINQLRSQIDSEEATFRRETHKRRMALLARGRDLDAIVEAADAAEQRLAMLGAE